MSKHNMTTGFEGRVELKLKRLTETDEWRVSVFVDRHYLEGPSYYTDDKQDAIDTLKMMAEQMNDWDETMCDTAQGLNTSDMG